MKIYNKIELIVKGNNDSTDLITHENCYDDLHRDYLIIFISTNEHFTKHFYKLDDVIKIRKYK